MLDDILDLTGDLEIFVAGAGAIVFAASYATFFNWRKTAPGRALLYFVLSLIALVALNAMGRWVGEYPFREYFRVAVYTAIMCTVWRLVFVLWRNWRKGDERPLNIETKQRTKEKTMITIPNTVEPTQVRYPWKTTIRTAIQAFLSAAAILALVAPQLQEFIDQFWPGSPVIAWIGTGSVFVAALAALITRIMAIPAVDALLTKIGIGAKPSETSK